MHHRMTLNEQLPPDANLAPGGVQPGITPDVVPGRRRLSGLQVGALACSAVALGGAVAIGVQVAPAVQEYFATHHSAPEGAHVLSSEAPTLPGSPSVPPTAGTTSAAPTPEHSSAGPRQVAPGIDLVGPSSPVSIEYIPLHGKPETFGVGTTHVQTTRKVSDGVLTVTQTVDPPLVYCPGSHPNGVSDPHFAKTQAGCNEWYQVTDYGLPHSGAWPRNLPKAHDKPLVLAAHTSNRGNQLSGNIIKSIRGGKLVVRLASGATMTYAIEPKHVYPRKGSADLPESIAATPATSLIVFTCLENNVGNNDLVRADLVAATAAP